MIISVDHGNKSIKTPNLLFTSGLIVSDNQSGIKSDSTEAAATPKKSFWAWTLEVRPLVCRHPLQKRSCSPQK